MPIIFFNIGWMCKYQGDSTGDKVKGDFKHTKNYGSGDEKFNFMPLNGYLYGYRPLNDNTSNNIRLENLGGKKEDKAINNITVVFISRNPADGWAYIVGWYKNATVYRVPQKLAERKIGKRTIEYCCKTLEKEGVCVPESQRTFKIPSAKRFGKGYYGKNSIWYAKEVPQFITEVKKYINSYKPVMYQAVKKIHLNMEKKILVEKNAVEAVIEYYTNLGFIVSSVEKDNLGWDLEACLYNGLRYFVEVKGLAGEEIAIQLTSNEYDALKRNYSNYRLAICTNSLNTPNIHIFSIKKDNERIYASDDEGNILEFIEKIAANAKLIH